MPTGSRIVIVLPVTVAVGVDVGVSVEDGVGLSVADGVAVAVAVVVAVATDERQAVRLRRIRPVVAGVADVIVRVPGR